MAIKKELKQKNPRPYYPWADLLRAISIYLVVVAHVNPLPSNPSLFDIGMLTFYGFFGLLSVPLFVMISGALLLNRQESYISFFSKRTKKTLVPWIFWSLVFVVWRIYVTGVSVDTFFELLRLTYRIFMSQFWFLPMLFGLYLLTPFLRVFLLHAKRIDVVFILILWFGLYSLSPIFFGNRFSINSYPLQFSGYFLLGYFLVKYPIDKKISAYSPILFLILVLSAPLYFLLFHLHDIRSPNFLYSHLSPIVLIASCIFFDYAARNYRNIREKIPDRLARLLSSFGRVSLGIYLVHLLAQDALNRIISSSFPSLKEIPTIFATPLFSILVFLLAYSIIYILRKIPLLRNVAG